MTQSAITYPRPQLKYADFTGSRLRTREEKTWLSTANVRPVVQDATSDLKIAAVEAFRLRLPYKSAIAFRSVKQSAAEYVILRIATDSGAEGIAELVCRPEHSGEDATLVAYQIENFFKPLLLGKDPLGNAAIMASLSRIRACRAAKSLIDTALWDLRGKVLRQPVWRLLGGGTPSLCRSPGSRTATRARPWWTRPSA